MINQIECETIMSNFFKKIPAPIIVLIVTLIISWTTWVTAQSYTSQQTKITVENHIVEVQKQQNYIVDQLDKIKNQMTKENEKLSDKISQNNKEMYQLLLDIQKQMGGKNG